MSNGQEWKAVTIAVLWILLFRFGIRLEIRIILVLT